MNNYRVEKNLSRLILLDFISYVADEHSEYMIEKGKVSHDNFPDRVIKLKQSINAKSVSENVAFGYNTAQGVFNGWLKSPSHKKIIEIAVKKKIPFQRHASSRSTGTDTDAFAYSNGGVASALISLPLRYMHTTVEMVHRDDVENVIRMIYETLLKIKEGETFSYFK